MASDICRPSIKAVYDGPITLGRIFNLLTMTLDIHLCVTLQQDIDLKSFILVGFSTLGTKAIQVAFTHVGRVEVSKKYLTTAIKSLPIIFQHLLKNKEVYPFGPRALSHGMENSAAFISSSVIGDSKTKIMLGGILLEKYLEVSS